MATGDVFSVEVYYQSVEEVLSLNLTYTEGAEALPVVASKELSNGFAAAFAANDLFTLQSADFRFYGCRVKCISDNLHNTWEDAKFARGASVEGNLPDLVTQIWTITGIAPDGMPTFSRFQFSGCPQTVMEGANLKEDYAQAVEAAIWPSLQVIDGPNSGQWIWSIPHVPDPLEDVVGVPATSFAINRQTGTRYDRKANTPNTGRKPRDPAVQSTSANKRRSRAARSASRQRKLGQYPPENADPATAIANSRSEASS